jgi:hypothetical protein
MAFRRIFCAALAAFGSLAFAADGEYFQLGIGENLTHFAYAEELTLPAKSSETATYSALVAQTRIFFSRTGFTNIEAKYYSATSISSTYDGSDLNTGAPVRATNTLAFSGYEATFNLALTSFLMVYYGIGGHTWNRFLSGTPGYREIYTWRDAPAGVRLLSGYRIGTMFGLDFSVRPMNHAKIKVITSQTYSGGQDSEMDLVGRKGYRVAIPVQWRGRMGIYGVTPWFEHYAFGKSQVVANSTLAPTAGTGIYEPDSHTNEFGIEFTASFGLF